MSLVRFKAQNHVQQLTARGVKTDVDDRATPPDLFAEFDRRFQFSIDVAASPDNTKLPLFYTVEDDGLRQFWGGGRVWCNPPYSRIWPWVRKAWAEYRAGGCPLIVMLLPANRTEQRWWQREIEPFRDRPGSGLRAEFLPGRIRFIGAGKESVGPNERPPFGCCLLIWEAVCVTNGVTSLVTGA